MSNEWIDELAISDWAYGEKENSPIAVAKHGTVKFSYSDKEDGTYKETVPTNAGIWYVKATVEENRNYVGLETVKTFEIKKAVPEYKVPNNLTIEKGKSLSIIKLPEGFSWKDENQIADRSGVHAFKAIYTPADTQNYQVVETDIIVNVVEKNVPPSDTDKTDNTNQSDTSEKVSTSDNTNVFVWYALLLVSLAGIVSLALFKQIKNR